MKCILLVRVSTEAQSYDEQEKELYDLAHFYGYKDKDISSIATKESAIKLDEEERFGLNRMKNYWKQVNMIACSLGKSHVSPEEKRFCSVFWNI